MKRDHCEHPHIFIAGCGRSGTTYLKTLLDAHPDIFIPTESLFLVDYLVYRKIQNLKIYSTLFFKEPQLQAWYTGSSFKIDNIADAIHYIHSYEAMNNNALLWGQKTPRFIRFIDLFEQHISNIKWILIYRDPRAVVNSMLQSKRHTYSCTSAINRWLKDNNEIIYHIKSKNIPNNILIMKYEDIINDIDSCLDNLFKFIGVKSIDTDTIFKKAKVVPLKGSKFPVNTVRESVSPQPKFMNNWMELLSNEQIYLIENRCKAYMDILNYKKSYKKFNMSKIKYNYIYILDKACCIKNLLIVKEYLQKWPSYIFHTLIRKSVFFLCRLKAKNREP